MRWGILISRYINIAHLGYNTIFLSCMPLSCIQNGPNSIFDLVLHFWDQLNTFKKLTNSANSHCDYFQFDTRTQSRQGGQDMDQMTMTNEVKSNECNQCDFASIEAGNLKKHLETHSGEKPDKCSQCEFASLQAGNLRRHSKTHSGEKPNKCNQCGFASIRASHLKTHLKTHSGEKSNKCNQCDFESSWACALRRHLKRHKREKAKNDTNVTLFNRTKAGGENCGNRF